ncbi:MAG: UTP--glucose-1-phosphate uridylyltransferase [SAR324 cluster bacterium]|nr:UTP--glucose-1-phosphate uridylyltransferase [SAR324 cluster bacterium]
MKGVILAAGYATRFLPASKTIPKEMFPIIDTPAIDYIVKEMVNSGIQDILIVSSRRKKSLEDYFDHEIELETTFTEAKKLDRLEKIEPIAANIFIMRQHYMMGTGNALMLVEPFVSGEPFVVAYPDDIVLGDPPLSKQLIDAYNKTGNTILAVQEVKEDVSRYGVIDPEGTEGVMGVRQMVEKPDPGTEPSHLVSFGRYLYTPDLFDILRQTVDDAREGEFTQTEAINSMARVGKVSAVRFTGQRYDVGEPLGYVQTTIKLALQDKRYREELLQFMKEQVDGAK